MMELHREMSLPLFVCASIIACEKLSFIHSNKRCTFELHSLCRRIVRAFNVQVVVLFLLIKTFHLKDVLMHQRILKNSVKMKLCTRQKRKLEGSTMVKRLQVEVPEKGSALEFRVYS